MSLTGAFQIGRTALTASQLAIQVTGNNVSNAATPGYSRQLVGLGATQDGRFGTQFIGAGVDVLSIRRNVDDALQARLWSSLSQESQSNTDLGLLSTVETSLRGLDANSLSSQITDYFKSWSNLADSPGTAGNRSLVVQSGKQLAAFMKQIRSELTSQRDQIDRTLESTTSRANDLLSQVAELNKQIVTAEGGQGVASGLRDQRDRAISDLSQLLDVTPVEQQSGAIDLLVGSTPVVLAGKSRGVELRIRTSGNTTEAAVITKDNQEVLPISSGSLGSLLGQRDTLVQDSITRLDEMATVVIARVNKLHSAGQTSTPLRSVTGELGFRTSDQTLALNDPNNQTIQGLPTAMRPTSGQFKVTVKNSATGASQTVVIPVDLDGIDNTFAAGTTNDTTLAGLRTALGGIANVTASITADGKLKVDAASGYELTFSDDSSGVLATLGVNTFFTGTDASNIAVRGALSSDPNLLAAGWLKDGEPSSNGAALALSQLASKGIEELGGVTFNDRWDQAVQSVAVRTSAAKTNAGATKVIRENLDAQRSGISGVSLDEEAINLLTYQRQYQAAARFITTVDELTQTLLQIAR